MDNEVKYKRIAELNGYNFIIPSYQRGYRWNSIHVEQFIDDIYENESEYCIQPLVVNCNENDRYATDIHEEIWSVIDGQQRLTTILIMIGVLRYLNKGQLKDEIIISLEYETRVQSREFLDFIILKDNYFRLGFEKLDWNSIWNKFNKSKDKCGNLDFEYMMNTFNIAKDKYEKMGTDYEKLYQRLINKCKFIWYPIESQNQLIAVAKQKGYEKKLEIEQFSRINMGKIPLTDAELIKAEFMNPKFFGKDYKSDIKSIAEQWYTIENELHQPDFWAFIPHENQYEDRNIYKTRIDELFQFLLVANWIENNPSKENYKEENKTNLLQRYFLYNQVSKWLKNTSNTEDILGKWEKVKEIFDNIKELYENDGRTQNYEVSNEKRSDKNNYVGLYNLIGYLIYISAYVLEEDQYSVCKEIYEILSENREYRVAKVKTKIFAKIKKLLNINADIIDVQSELEDKIKTLEYIEKDEKNNNKIRAILLLYNIILLSKNTGIGNRYDFLRYRKWTIEHIFSQKEKLLVYEADKVEELKKNIENEEASIKKSFEIKKNKEYERIYRVPNEAEREKIKEKVDKNLENYKEQLEKGILELKENLKRYRSFEQVDCIRRKVIQEMDNYYNCGEEKNKEDNKEKISQISKVKDLFDHIDEIQSDGIDGYISEKLSYIEKIIVPKHEKVLLSKLQKKDTYEEINFQKIIRESQTINEICQKICQQFKFNIYSLNSNESLKEEYEQYKNEINDLKNDFMEYEYEYERMINIITKCIVDDFFKLLKDHQENQKILKELKIKELLTHIYRLEIDEYFRESHNEYMKDNSIRNLTLLRNIENKKIANEYSKKKQLIYKYIKTGTVIPYSTLLVFFDVYTNNDYSLSLETKWQWLPNDREMYLKDLLESIIGFFYRTDRKDK